MQKKNTGNVLKVVELGLESRIYEEMKKPKFSVEAITRILNDEGINITAQSIRKFIKNTKNAQRELIAKDINTANEIKKLTIDYTKAIKSILTEVEEVKNLAKDEKDYATYNQLIGRLYQGLELIAKLTGELRPSGTTDIKIIYNEINADIENKMKDMKKKIFRESSEIIDIDIQTEDSKIAESLETR